MNERSDSRLFLKIPAAVSVLMLAAGLCLAQTPSRAEKLEARMRVEIIKATKDIHVPVIKAAELKSIIADTNLVLIDIRQPKEQEVSMLPHALTTAEFAEKFRKGIPSGKRLVVYCTIGYRSGKYAETLARQGIKSENLEGGVLAWTFVGGEFLTRDASGNKIPTNRVHTYEKEWNLVHPDYVGVW
jgi:rhodanese-related sulfurtransferase